MRWSRYFQLKEIFDQFDVKPLLGVIPDNQDPRLKRYPPCEFDFWEHIRQQQAAGWDIAVHGYQHRLDSPHSGILGISNRSEFAALPYAVQYEKLSRALEIFAKHGIRSETFIAPAHSFDATTIQALKAVGTHIVSDGFALYPSWKDGVLTVPQLFAYPRKMPFGVYTFCIHPNTMTGKQLARIKAFLGERYRDVIPFGDCAQFAVPAWVQQPAQIILRRLVLLRKSWKAR